MLASVQVPGLDVKSLLGLWLGDKIIFSVRSYVLGLVLVERLRSQGKVQWLGVGLMVGDRFRC